MARLSEHIPESINRILGQRNWAHQHVRSSHSSQRKQTKIMAKRLGRILFKMTIWGAWRPSISTIFGILTLPKI
jgi:hypothetical protein